MNVDIPANLLGSLHCDQLQALGVQRATLSVLGQTFTLMRTGAEGAGPMQAADGSYIIALPAQPQGYQIKAIFEYASGSEGPFLPSNITPPEVEHKDGFAITRLSVFVPPSSAASATLTIVLSSENTQAVPRAAVAAASALAEPQLELHAKTYYDNPLLEGAGDEHYFTISQANTDGVATLRYASTGWTATQSSAYYEFTPFGGYIHVFVKAGSCPHPGMHDAVLDIGTTYGYWVTQPTGVGSANWQANLTGTTYRITRVIN